KLFKKNIMLSLLNIIRNSISVQLILLAVFSIVTAIVLTGFLSFQAARKALINKLMNHDLKKIVELKSEKINSRIKRAMETSLSLASDPVIIEWFKSNEKDERLGKFAKDKLKYTGTKYDYSVVFAVNHNTLNHWKEDVLLYVVDKNKPDDSWYFDFFNSGKSIEINIDSSDNLKSTFMFINAIIGTKGEKLGVAGIGVDLTKIAKEFTKVDEYQGNSWLIDNKGKIKISSDFTQLNKSISTVLGEKAKFLENWNRQETKTDEYFKNNERLIFAYTSIGNTGWTVVYSVSFEIIAQPLTRIRYTTLISGIMSAIMVILIFYSLSKKYIKSIKELTEATKEIADGNLNVNFRTDLQNEIGTLANSFEIMVERLAITNKTLLEYNQNLELKVNERTSELNLKLEEIKILKNKQDGDYLLMSQLVQPFIYNKAKSNTFKIECFLRQLKYVEKKGKAFEVGGDTIITENIVLKNKNYIVVMNGDAMGKSLQGAGGVLVMGTVFNMLLDQTHKSKKEANQTPESWLYSVYGELHKVFFSFEGWMYMTLFLGLIDEESGEIFFLSLEHPYPILYNENKIQFISPVKNLSKLGSLEKLQSKPPVSHIKLLPGESLFIGSDGKDDLIKKAGNKEPKEIKIEEGIFLEILKESGGSIDKIIEMILSSNKLIDDISIVKIMRKNN
ncbi:MAG: SpoIIE family protein phosphatase, partial [Leptospiraceae bacterium]|nr:SpoIIE family protein phosphatase [Leptospiraceae bacterium]